MAPLRLSVYSGKNYPTLDMHIQQDEKSERDIEELAASWWLRMQEPTPETLAAFNLWLSEDPRHKVVFDQMDSVSRHLDSLPQAVKQQVRQASSRTAYSLAWLRNPLVLVYNNLSNLVLGAGIAACLIITIHQYLSLPIYAEEIRTVRGQIESVTLPDASKVILDTDTSVKVSYYRDRREVSIVQGQAFFSVTKDPEKPFDVYAGLAKVTVVGTKFTVRYLGGHVSVAVSEGKVNVSKLNNDLETNVVSPYLITLGQALDMGPNGQFSQLRSVSANDVDAWTQGRLVFNNTRLEDAITEFSRYARINLVVNNQTVANYRITGSFERTKLDSFAKALPSVLPVQLVKDGANIKVVPR